MVSQPLPPFLPPTVEVGVGVAEGAAHVLCEEEIQ